MDKIVNDVRMTIYQNPKYTSEQKMKSELDALENNIEKHESIKSGGWKI